MQAAVQESEKKKLVANAFWLYSLQGLNYLLPMLVLPYLIRKLGAAGYGTIAVAQSFAQYFVVLTDYGFNISATKKISLMRQDADQISRFFWCVYFIKAALMILGLLLLLLLTTFVKDLHGAQLNYLVAYLVVFGSVLFPVWYFQGMENMRAISIITACGRILATAAVFVFVHGVQDTTLALFLLSLGQVIAGTTAFVAALATGNLSFRLPARVEIVVAIREGWHLFVSGAAVTLYTNTNVFLVGMMSGPEQAGYFSTAEKILRAAQGLLTPITQVLFPHINTLLAKSREGAITFIRKSLVYVAVPMFAASLGILLLSPWLSQIVFGFSNPYTVNTLRWISFLPFLVAVSNLLGVQTMIPFGFEKPYSRILIMAGILNVCLAQYLIRHFVAPGAGAAVLLSEIFVTLAMWFYLRRVGIDVVGGIA